MGRRDADERPPIEILGADLGVSSTQQVELGRRRHPRRGRSMVIAALAGALLVGGLVLGGSDEAEPERPAEDEQRDNNDHIELGQRRTTTTRPPTTTTTAPEGPPFGEPVEGVILASRFGTRWTRLDLATGDVSEVTLPSAEMFASVALRGGLVIPSPSGEVRFYGVLDGDRAPEGVFLGRGDQVVRASPDAVWLFDQPLGSDDTITEATLVDLEGEELRRLEVPGYQGMATYDDIIVNRGGRVYTYDGSGYRPLATGFANGIVGDDVLITACDDDAACTLRLQPSGGRRSTELIDVVDPDTTYYEPPSVAEDGRFAVMAHGQGPDDQHLLVFSSGGDLIADVAVSTQMGAGLPQWLPGDLGLLVSSSSGIKWIRPARPEWTVEDLPYDVGSGTFFVITP